MNNIAVQNRTEASEAAPETVRKIRLVLACTVLSLLLVSFTPFVLQYQNAAQGNVLNQIGYTSLALTALAGHLMFTRPAVILSLLRPAWLLILGMLLLSVLHSRWPDNALRAWLFTITAMIGVTGAICLPATARDFRTALAVAALAILGLSYAGIIVFPAEAIHGAGGDEPQHAGLWRGIYSHKNIAGPVMAMLLFAGIYLWRSGNKRLGLVIALLSAFFIYKTGSKTTLGLVPIVAFAVIGGRILGGRLVPVLILGIAMTVLALMTLGAAFSPTLNGILQTILPGTTFTGRLDLWRFTLDLLRPHQWTGFGIESFWSTDIVYKAEKPFELSWDPRDIVNSHSGYLELAVWGGWPTLLAALPMLVLLPMKDYLSTQRTPENQRLADFFLMVLTFVLLNSFLEAYLFSRGNPIWLFGFLSIVGLRLTSRYRLD